MHAAREHKPQYPNYMMSRYNIYSCVLIVLIKYKAQKRKITQGIYTYESIFSSEGLLSKSMAHSKRPNIGYNDKHLIESLVHLIKPHIVM